MPGRLLKCRADRFHWAKPRLPSPGTSVVFDRAYASLATQGFIRWHQVDPVYQSMADDHYVPTDRGALVIRAWDLNELAQRQHTYEAWQVAADAFDEAGFPEAAREVRASTASLRRNLPRRELLHVAIQAADRFLERKRPTERNLANARTAAFEEIRRADRLAGTPNHHAVRNTRDISVLAARGVLLAQRLHWTGGGGLPSWRERVGRYSGGRTAAR